ncbi:hypothetical protein OIE71_04610 [Streptomyces sp. NBC_01725]|uniref:hypothetical protein n=1 Tax=Streptomyces sp. NBC_01725 TaxID=2975923 RepID=UPI002E2C42FB|nr:hypothetical protein [Streptomyces sp. NBC_01725]
MSDDRLFDLDDLDQVEEDLDAIADYLGDLPAWLIECGRPATRGPKAISPFRPVYELPPLDDYQPVREAAA